MRYKLICFDLDGCLTEKDDSWSFIHRKLGVWEQAKQHRKLFFGSKINYQQWADLDVGLWKGTSIDDLESIIKQIKVRPNVREIVQELKNRDLILIIISGGLSYFAERIREEYGFDYAIANSPITSENGILNGKCVVTVNYNDKHVVLKSVLEEIYRDRHIHMKECIAIGDGENDIPLFNEVGYSIAFNPLNDSVAGAANRVVRNGDLLEVLNIILAVL